MLRHALMEPRLKFDGTIEAMFRRFVILLMILVTPFAQAQAVLECAVMDLKIAVRCCCHGEHQPLMKLRGTNNPCCAVEIQVGERQFVAAAAESSNQRTAKVFPDDEPVAAILSTAPFFANVVVRISPSIQPFAAHVFPTVPTYLRTARLRL